MNEISTRTAEVIAGEINQIKAEVRDTVIRAAIEIGKKLKEAKALVPYGQWGDWLAENVDYSERTAQNYMAIADEYGQKETQALAQIRSKEQAILLLALDEREREAFVQQHDLGAMSTRELKEELERVKAERDKLQLTMDEMLGHAQDKPDAEAALVLASEAEIEAERAELNNERKKLAGLLNSLNEKKEQMDMAMRETQAAKEQAAQARERAGDLERSLMEARKQVDETEKRRRLETKQEKDARKKAQEQHDQQMREAQEQLDALRAQLEAAQAEVQTVEVVPEAVEKELQALRAKAARGGVEQELHSLFAIFRQDFSRLVDKLEEAEESGQADLAAKYRAAFAKATTVMAGRLDKANEQGGGVDT